MKGRRNHGHPRCFSRERGSHIQGMTLVELIIAIAIGAILIGVALPYFSGMIAGNQVNTSFRNLRTFLDVARNEAINRKIYVSICPRKDTTGYECFDSSYGSSAEVSEGWHKGWIMHHHRTKSNASSIIDSSQIMKVQEALDNRVEVKFTGTPEYIRFNPYGESYPSSSTISFCVKDASTEYHAREIILSNGRTRVTSKDETSCL